MTRPLGKRSQGPAFAALLVVTTALAGCERTLDMESAEAVIKSGLTERLEMPFAAVSCPESRAMKAGDVFECQATAESGDDLTVQVTQKDDTGTVIWKLAYGKVLSLTALEQQIKDGLAKLFSVDASVDCGGKHRVTVKGQTFECTAKAGSESRRVIVTMDDEQGNVTWALK
jgi:hypothetical protein